MILAAGAATAAETPEELNKAQLLVFLGDHLQLIPAGATVVYRFAHRETGLPEHQDEVRMTVTKVRDDALRDLSFEFLSGADRLPFQPAQGYRGNPVAIQFLERDIRDMALQTGRPVAHFRNRIKKAFNDPWIEETRVTVGDATFDATEIKVTPFASDPDVAKFEGYANKEYRFVYAAQIPGGLVDIRTHMQVQTGAMEIEEELSFSHMGKLDESGTSQTTESNDKS